jgi:hypothetical protein
MDLVFDLSSILYIQSDDIGLRILFPVGSTARLVLLFHSLLFLINIIYAFLIFLFCSLWLFTFFLSSGHVTFVMSERLAS